MARRRKNEVKPSVKSSLKYVPVRKSSRQIAKKQLEEKKVNGDVQMSCSNIVDDTRIIRDNQTEGIFKKSQNSQKKYSKHKDSSNKEEITFNSSYKRDAGESDSQDGLDVLDQSDKLSPEDVRQMVVGNPNTNNECLVEPTTREVEVWPEDIIEETIICEEMEVEGDVAENSYNLAQEDNVTVEQVLLVDEPNLEGKNFVEYTVIQNEDGTQSMVVASSNTNISSSSGYHIIQDGVKSMHVTEANNTISTVYSTDSSHLNNENSKDALRNFDKVYGNKKKIILDLQNCAYKNDNKISKKIDAETEKRSIDKERIEDNCSLSKDITQENGMYTMKSHKSESKDTYSSEKYEETTKEDAFCKIDNKLATMQLNDSSKEIEKLVNDLCSVESVDSPVQTCINIEKISPINEDDESSSSILDKMEQLHRQNNSEPNPDMTNVYHKSIEQGNKEQNILESDTCFEKIGCPSQSSLNSGGLQDKIGKEEKSFDHLQNTEETCVDSEPDGKIDSEDMKLSSSGDSSNDTLLSINNYKVPELDVKGMQNSTNDSDKKVEFRSRSGSTDTTGSESGSNSSGVRRSSRIRSIGLMKQRSRGRGLVTKFNTDVSKATFPQEKDKIIINSTSVSQEVKMNVDNQSEQQCDKENGSNKIPSALDSFPPLVANCNTAGYDSDSSKPVKVKSRWRRSSELEMGGSSSGFGATASTVFSYSSGFTCESISHVAAKSLSDSTMGEQGTSECGYGGSASMIASAQPATEINQDNENLLSTSFIASTITQLSKTVGTKIPLPMVLESKDREMEERLSQFEHLHENLYLTDRYTNKETKRMVCDCFLTEEEIERGELGCGEDCLNRLLMIECGPRCVVGDRCTNKRFQNCDYAKCEIFRTEKKGFGLRAAVDLDIGEFIMEYVGEVVDPKDFRRRAKEYSKDKNRHYYFMALKSDQIIDATMKGNISRFINHSCDPNAETQKWTVNGELRIGFFNKKFITAGEEITFDYHFQRYGKEAQKCFCEAPNCRGWIGDTPEEEKEKIDKKEKREKDMKKKKEEKKPTDYMEDEDLEEEIGKLCSGGLKNRAHTLTLSRLMVRSREPKHRTRLLRLIQSGEQPCRRLFLDYHGLRLIWSYVMDISANESDEAQQFRLEILKTLNTLPIPNKTMLMDSKIYSVVERWANRLHFSPNRDSPEDEQLKSKGICEDVRTNYDSNIRKNSTNLHEISDMPEGNIEHLGITEIKSENTDQSLIIDIASNLLSEWSNLKEVFRIPKKERIEQMKEHEREADRGYREELEKEEKRGTSYDRHRPDRYGRNEVDKRVDRRRGRESPEAEHNKAKDKKVEERSSLVPIPRMTKYERRQLFALKVAKEEEERQRRQQQESWQEHESRCLALGIDPHSTAMLDPQTGYPVFYNPSIGQWQHYSTQDGGEIVQQCTPVYIPGTQPLPGQATVVSQNPHMLPSAISSEISPSITTGIPSGVPPVVYSLNQTPVFNQTTTSYSLLSHCHQQYPESQLPLSNNVMSVQGVTPPMPVQYPATTSSDNASCQPPVVPEVPPIDLPPKWKTAVDARGRTYYYHVKERVSQWLPPPPDHIGVQPDSSSTSESSEESSSSNEDEEDVDDERVDQKNEDVDFENNAIESTATDSRYSGSKKVTAGTTGSVPIVASKKRRDGLVQERIISPRREEDRVDHKAYKELKEKLRRQKEKAKLKEYVEKLRKHRRSNKSKSHSRHGLSKTQSISSNLSTMSERKIKDTFRINMANVMVHFLNPYRKNDCKQGRITNTEDFKHLARKLTHFVLAKELKHCKSVDELQCNENVKHKAKDFVRKYMSKFGAVYQKGTDED